MKTFLKCAEVLRIAFPEWTIDYKRHKVGEALQRYMELREPYVTLPTCFI